jgi:hypothetical protein
MDPSALGRPSIRHQGRDPIAASASQIAEIGVQPGEIGTDPNAVGRIGGDQAGAGRRVRVAERYLLDA